MGPTVWQRPSPLGQGSHRHQEKWPLLLAVNVAWHTAQSGQPPLLCTRKAAHEDCCGYCERYCQDKLTACRHKLIEKWAADVNRHMAAFNKPQSHHRQTKIKYLRYSPPGTPDTEAGFRRLAKPNSRKGVSCSGGGVETDALSLSCDSTSDRSKIAQQTADCGHSSSSRSSSNELLNVLSIDDALSSGRHKYYARAVASSSHRRVQTPISACDLPQDQIQHRLQSIAKFRSSTGQLASDNGLCLHGNATTIRACDTLIGPRQILNNTSFQRLSGSGNHSVYRQHESKRFRKMNENLHRLIECEYVPDRKLRLKLQQRSGAVGGAGATSPAGAGERPVTSRAARRQGRMTHGQNSQQCDQSSDDRLLEMIMQIDSPTDSEQSLHLP